MNHAPPGPRVEDLSRSQRTMILVRWVAVPWALLQVLSYNERPYPAGIEEAALALVALLAAANLALHVSSRRASSPRAVTGIAVAGLLIDTVVISGFVWLYSFDPDTALWAVLFIVPLEGAVLFSLPGAMGAWGVSSILYAAREVWGSRTYDYSLQIGRAHV